MFWATRMQKTFTAWCSKPSSDYVSTSLFYVLLPSTTWTPLQCLASSERVSTFVARRVFGRFCIKKFTYCDIQDLLYLSVLDFYWRLSNKTELRLFDVLRSHDQKQWNWKRAVVAAILPKWSGLSARFSVPLNKLWSAQIMKQVSSKYGCLITIVRPITRHARRVVS